MMMDTVAREFLAWLKDFSKEWLAIERQKLSSGPVQNRTASGVANQSAQGPRPSVEVVIAPESDWTDPKVTMGLKNWNGPDMKGLTFSKTSSEFLKQYARTLEWIAKKEDDEGKTYKNQPASQSTRKNAGLALRWAERLKAATPATHAQDTFPETIDDVPF